MSAVSRLPVVDVCGKRTLDYLLACLGKFNRKASSLTVRAIGANTPKAITISHVLENRFRAETTGGVVTRTTIDGVPTSSLQLTISPKSKRESLPPFPAVGYQQFVPLPVYHLLFDWLVSTKGPVTVLKGTRSKGDKVKHAGEPLLSLHSDSWDFTCRVLVKVHEKYPQSVRDIEGITEAYYRSGMLLGPRWRAVGRQLSEFDDIILGADTNIISRATISEQLLSSLFLIDPRSVVHTPNWILIVVPNGVIHELEQAANSRNDGGFLTRTGRSGFRGLQEILELNRSADLSGVSLLIVGEADPALDTRVELRALRDDFSRSPGAGRSAATASMAFVPRRRSGASGDMMIRSQFRWFLRQIDFHKGVFFLTADKSNAALASAEGLQSVLYKPPHWRQTPDVLAVPKIRCEPGPDISVGVLLGRLIYELAVQFGTIRLKCAGEEIVLGCDSIGESLEHWLRNELQVLTAGPFNALLRECNSAGLVSVLNATEAWREISDQFLGSDSSEEQAVSQQ
jgi:DNA-binding protein